MTLVKYYIPSIMKILSNRLRKTTITTFQCAKFFTRFFIFFSLFGILICCSNPVENNKQKPNILLVVADDLGYSDLGCYGGDIETPNINSLAENGIRFSRFNTNSTCAVSRAMLLSGNDNHIAGVGRQNLYTNEFGYEGQLTNRIITISELLMQEGYHTFMAGKWHLGHSPESNPHTRGFEHSFALIQGGGNHYNNRGVLRNTYTNYTEDGDSANWREGDYSTDFYTDKIIGYIDSHKDDDKPFFAYVAYTAPHWPLQVDENYWQKYKGLYNDGYEKLKESRFESLKKAGIIPDEAIIPPSRSKILPWDSLSAKQKLKESRKMELYAGMVDNLDFNMGRLITHLKNIGEYENTLIVFMSDNGAAGEDFFYSRSMGPKLKEYYNDDYDNMGNFDSYISYGAQWAEAGTAPFSHYKGFTMEGGIIAPMILSGPNIKKKNVIYDGLVTLMDIAPTFYEATSVTYPEATMDNKLYPLRGKSILPFASGKVESVHDSLYVFGLEHRNQVMIKKGDWKITNIISPFLVDNFGLFNISKDIGEQTDLKASEPDKFNEMLKEWTDFADEIKVQIPSPPFE